MTQIFPIWIFEHNNYTSYNKNIIISKHCHIQALQKPGKGSLKKKGREIKKMSQEFY